VGELLPAPQLVATRDRVHMGVTLLVSGVSRQLFIPTFCCPRISSAACSEWWRSRLPSASFYGALARPRRRGARLTWIIGTLVFGPLRLIEHTEILGVAFFPLATGRGPLAFDMALGKLNKPVATLIPYAVPVLRVALGIGLTIVRLHREAVEHSDGARLSVGSSLQLLSVHWCRRSTTRSSC